MAAHLKSKKGFLFNTLIDITAVDFPDKEQRFEVIYHFLSMSENLRCRVTISIDENEAVPSITPVFECANWFEREIFDLFGIKFTSHPDLRRILTDYGFKGHPLRKDFPTSGFLEVRYDEVEKRVIYEPTTLTQGYRDFDFLSPWDNPEVYTNTDVENKN
jgi:NADH-quinone oxidoreductase subunit C